MRTSLRRLASLGAPSAAAAAVGCVAAGASGAGAGALSSSSSFVADCFLVCCNTKEQGKKSGREPQWR